MLLMVILVESQGSELVRTSVFREEKEKIVGRLKSKERNRTVPVIIKILRVFTLKENPMKVEITRVPI